MLAKGVVWSTFLACCALPLAWMLVALFSMPDPTAALHPLGFHLRLLGRTLAYNAAVASVATLLGLPVALALGAGRRAVSITLAFVLPGALLLPSIVYAYGWMQVLRVAGVQTVPGTPPDVLRCVWTLATWLWPIPAGLIGLSLRRMDADLQQQALLDGGYWRVVARQLLAPAAAAFAIVAILAMQEFPVYEPTGISVVATEVRTVFETGQIGSMTNQIADVKGGQFFSFARTDQQHNAAAAMITAMPLLLVIGVFALVATFLGKRGDDASDFVDVSAKPRVLSAGWVSVTLAATVIGVTFVLPLVMMVVSIRRPFDAGRIWRTFYPSILGTLSIAAMTGGVAAVLATFGLVRRFRWPAVLGLITFLVGGQLLAIAMIRLYNRPVLGLAEWVYNGPLIVVMAYVARFGWLAAWAARSTWRGPWRGLRDMAAVDGATAAATARHVVWPVAWPLVAACAVLTLLLAMTEVPATVLINPLRPQVFVPYLMTWVHTLRSDDMLEGSLLLAALVIALAAVVVALTSLWRRRLSVHATRSAGSLLILGPVVLCLAGCSRGDKPDEVWLETGAGDGQVVYPRGICYSKADDSYYVVDRMARVQHLDHDGKFIAGWRMAEFTQGKPTGLSVGPDGNVWVADTHYSRVMVFDPAGNKLKEFGHHGRGPGEFIYPSDVAFDTAGHVFVSEFGDHDRIQVFDANLTYLYEFGQFGDGPGQLSRPQSMVIDGQTLYVTDACNHRIAVFTTAGQFLRTMGRLGSGPGEFRFPYGLDIDSKGRLIVCEFGNNRVQRIDKETGASLGAWGSGGRDLGQLAYPWAAAVGKKDRIVTVDAGNNRLQVFAF